jgi:PiT family inorganic phosphate transporter
MEGALVLLVPSVLALANGGNDVSKGMATLVGSGVASYRRAARWGAAWTGLGAAVAFVGAGAMVSTFGNGLLAEGVAPSYPSALAALLGAAAWVLFATRASLPVSTTHALVGSLVGAAVAAYGVGGLAWPALGGRIVLPLLASPVAAFALARFATKTLARARIPECVCLGASSPLAVGSAGTLAAAPGLAISIASGHAAECERARPNFLRVTEDHLHWLSSGAVSFARGMNDAPKIVGLAAAAILGSAAPARSGALFALVSSAMVLGSLVAGRRVTRALAHDVTPMSHRKGSRRTSLQPSS